MQISERARNFREFPTTGLIAQKAMDFGNQKMDRIRSRLVTRTLQQHWANKAQRWAISRHRWTPGKVSVLSVGPANDLQAGVILKIAHSSEGSESLRKQLYVQSTLRRDPRLADWRHLVAEPITDGTVLGRYYVAEREIRGRSADSLPGLADRVQDIQAQAFDRIGVFHQRTARAEIVDQVLLDRWVGNRIRILRRALINHTGNDWFIDALDHLEAGLICWLQRRHVTTCWIHGDFWLGNVLVDDESGQLTGIIDWDRAGPSELALHDIIHMLLLPRKLLSNQWGESLLASALDGDHIWNAEEESILSRSHLELGDGQMGRRIALFLYWLRHTSNTINRLPSITRNADFIRDNVALILHRACPA